LKNKLFGNKSKSLVSNKAMRKVILIVTFIVCLFSTFSHGQSQSKEQKQIVVNCHNCKIVSQPKPNYPMSAKAVNASGKVSVEVLIDENGDVIEAKVVSGHPLLWAESEKAAHKAKFEPQTISGKPVKTRATLVYNFVTEEKSESEEQKEIEIKIKTQIHLGFLNNRTTFQPQPIYPKEVLQPRSGGGANVQIVINLQEGNVISANAVSGNQLFKKYAEEAALKAKFSPVKIKGSPLFETGILVYKHPSESARTDNSDNHKRLPVIVRDIAVNDRAKHLPRPEFPESCRCSGNIMVRIVVDMNGDVIDAVADSGHPLLRLSAIKAANKTKFAPTLINPGPIYVVAYLKYVFEPSGKVKM
jgi:TonB family protein